MSSTCWQAIAAMIHIWTDTLYQVTVPKSFPVRWVGVDMARYMPWQPKDAHSATSAGSRSRRKTGGSVRANASQQTSAPSG